MRDFFHSSFRNRIFSMMLAAVMLIVVCSNVILLNIYVSNSNERSRQQNEKQISRVQQVIETTFESFETISEEMEKSMLTKLMLRAEKKDSRILYQKLFERTLEWNEVAQFHIFNKDGICYYTTESKELNQTMDINWGPLYMAAQSDEMVVMSQRDESGLICTYAMRDIKGIILGYFVITMSKSNFDVLFQDLYDSDFVSLYLLDPFWRIVYAPNSARAEQTIAMLRPQILQGEYGGDLEDNNRYYVFHSGSTNFYFVLEQSNLYSNSVLEANRLVMIQMCSIALPVCMICAWLLSRYFSKPVSQLDHAMKEIEGGNYDVTLELPGKDEFGRLAMGFNKMARQYKKNLQNQQELNNAQLRMLQAQLNPHFLYNTMDTIKWLGVTHNVPVIAKLITSLAAILRSSISSKALVRLDDELDFLENYINIQCIRFDNKFSYEVDIDPNCFDCIVPKLILQPLVENSIVHGLENCEEGYLKISAYEDDGCLILRVYDNGCGLPDDILEWLHSEEKEKLPDHIGLYNVNVIIALQYGKAYGLSYVPGFSEGTCLQLRFPAKRDKASEIL